MTQTRDFHLGDVLSIATPFLMSPRGIEGVYDILGYMTGEPLWTHQLPRAGKECAPEILRQHPQLASANCEGVTPENHAARLAALVAQFGETLPIAPLNSREAQYDTPVADAIELLGGDTSRLLVIDE